MWEIVSMRLETSALLGWSGRDPCVKCYVGRHTRWQRLLTALPLDYNGWRWGVSMHVCESKGAKEYECEFIYASFTLVCLQGQPDTCQCNEASAIECMQVLVCVSVSDIIQNQCSRGDYGVTFICVWGCTGPSASLLHKGNFLLRMPLHLENVSHWLVEVTVLPGPLLPICFCVYVFVYRGVNLNLAKELNSLV